MTVTRHRSDIPLDIVLLLFSRPHAVPGIVEEVTQERAVAPAAPEG